MGPLPLLYLRFRDGTCSPLRVDMPPEQEAGSALSGSAKDYTMLSWNTQQVILPSLKACEIPEPWIVLVVPKTTEEEQQRQSQSLKKWALHGDRRKWLEKHLETSFVMTAVMNFSDPCKPAQSGRLRLDGTLTEACSVLVVCESARKVLDLYFKVPGSVDVSDVIPDTEQIKSHVSKRDPHFAFPESSGEDFVVLGWQSMNLVSEATVVSDLPCPRAVVRLPKAPLPELRGAVLGLRMWVALSEGHAQHRIGSFLDTSAASGGRPEKSGRKHGEPLGALLEAPAAAECRLILTILNSRRLVSGRFPRVFPCGALIAIGLGEMLGREPAEAERAKHVLVDWNSMQVLERDMALEEIPEPGIVLLLRKMPADKLRRQAMKVLRGALRHMREDIDMHLKAVGFAPVPKDGGEVMPPVHLHRLQVTEPPALGSKERPFESPAAILEFLQDSQPDKYVFRGQTRAYDGALLPSGIRGRFREIPSSGEVNPFAGITFYESETEAWGRRALAEQAELQGGLDEPEPSRCDPAPWLASEAEFQLGFERFWTEPAYPNPPTAIIVLRQATVGLLNCLFGMSIGQTLSQHYGLSSLALDATTAPEVAMFFATHEAPFYDAIGTTGGLGVIYRWPRASAAISEQALTGLENSGYVSLGQSLRAFVRSSKDLQILSNEVTREGPIWVLGPDRNFSALRFPPGAYLESRMGRQKGVLLWPVYSREDTPAEVVFGGLWKGKTETAAFVGDMLKTHKGEAFYFRHAAPGADLGKIDKFYLWPVHEHPSLRIDVNARAPVAIAEYDFQDKYLEFLLRFIASTSPRRIMVFEKITEDINRVIPPSLVEIGGQRFLPRVSGLCGVSPGFCIHPREAGTIASRLLGKSQPPGGSGRLYGNLLSGPISFPFQRFVPDDLIDEFAGTFREAILGLQTQTLE